MVVAAVPTTLALGVDSREDGRWLQVHHDALVQQLVNDQDDATHVVDERLTFDALSENSIEALVHAVKQHTQDQFIVVDVTDDEDSHVRVASENRNIVIDSHNIILEAIGASTIAAAGTLL